MRGENISVCICTFRRPLLLKRLLSALKQQRTLGDFRFSTVVIDNDIGGSAQGVANEFVRSLRGFHYEREPVQNIALARNRAISSSEGEYVAFIDDDEFPSPDWLYNLYSTCKSNLSDGSLGPVLPFFDGTPPGWLIQSGLCDRVSFETGKIMESRYTRTGNALIHRSVFCKGENMFNPLYGKTGGEDTDFFTRVISQGFRFVWCQEAPVYEWVPPERWRRSFYFKRAFIRGQVNHIAQRSAPRKDRFRVLARTALLFSFRSLCLPVVLLQREHRRMKFLNSYLHHAGRLATALRLYSIKNR